MGTFLPHCIQRFIQDGGHLLHQLFVACTRPARPTLVRGLTADLARGKAELVVENALLRQQLIVLSRQTNRPSLRRLDRLLLVMLASRVRGWRNAVVIVQPDTLLRWHRKGFRLVWKTTSASRSAKPRIPKETTELIRTMAAENRLWGAERIRGELRKLGIQVSKRTVQKHMRQTRPPHQKSQSWASFLQNHAHQVWACDFLQVTDLWFRSLFVFFVIELGSRKVVHVGVTRHPTDAWIAQQLRQATPFDQRPRYLIRDNDGKYGPQLARVAATSRIEVLRTPVRAPRANAICERFLGSVRRECLDHVLLFHEHHLGRVLREYVDYFNHARPHQGINQAIPGASETTAQSGQGSQTIVSLPILGSLHHDYRFAA
jgi:transposase InsO family protein